MEEIIIIGAGAAGLAAALELAKKGVRSVLVSDMPSERAQSAMAQGGINAAFPENKDSPALHGEETLRAGRYIADPAAVRDLAENAPDIIEELFRYGTCFTLNREGRPDVRAFGGQNVRRTFYAAADTGRQLMHTLIAMVRRYESEGLVRRMTGWLFLRLLRSGDTACGCVLERTVTGQREALRGKVIIASGGLNGLFGNATGSVGNTGAVTAALFADGVALADGEFIQYHPTTAPLRGKNMLITEAVRSEGGRLFTLREGEPYYFMEEKYPTLGNLMPRDVIAREEWALMEQGREIFLDMRGLDKEITGNKLRDVVENCREFLSLDPTKEPIPVVPGIHYFMGGIRVDRGHRTALKGLYAAGECACIYHGANRLGGNSLLGAIYGGKTAAGSAMEDSLDISATEEPVLEKTPGKAVPGSYAEGMANLQSILRRGLGIVRSRESLQEALEELEGLSERVSACYDPGTSEFENNLLGNGCLLGRAMLLGALERRESRGAHTRSDYPGEREEYRKQTVARLIDGSVRITFEEAGEQNAH